MGGRPPARRSRSLRPATSTARRADRPRRDSGQRHDQRQHHASVRTSGHRRVHRERSLRGARRRAV